ncbi:NUDIX domain-containing protein [Nocardiopsis sp. CNT-189]|uniref:NUDIX hydrolase n=1 Tax=Nocardiopsis oceanisediminis TaxID=2816862 RepID=UPI003B340CC3
MPEQEALRVSARVVLLDGGGRVLLLRTLADPDDPGRGHAWHTPGGGVEEGETLAEAASRELFEETGLSAGPAELGPEVAETSGYADLGWARGVFRDVFFHHRAAGHRVDAGGRLPDERRHLDGHRWWTAEEIAGIAEEVHPHGLAGLVAGLAAGRVPAEPLRLPWHH